MKRVCLSKCKEYDVNELDLIIEQQCKALNMDEVVKQGCKVMIKPNLVIKRKPEEATTTHPAVIAAVVRAVKRRGANRVVIGESSGGPYTPALLKSLYQGTGLTDMAKIEDVELNFDISSRKIDLPQAKRCHQFSIIEPYFQADVIINIAKLKTHGMTGMSGAVKNLFGLVPGLMKPDLHCQFKEKQPFSEMLVDLCEWAKPDFSFVDAIMCMEGDGPTGGNPRFMGAIISGRNPFAVDIVGCKLLNIQPQEILMMAEGINRGISPKSADDIEIIGENPDSMIVKDFKRAKSASTDFVDRLPRVLRKSVGKIVTPKPIIKDNCIRCGKCVESCPEHIIEIEKNKTIIHRKNCINCFCCHEMCPVKAIDIKHFTLFKL